MKNSSFTNLAKKLFNTHRMLKASSLVVGLSCLFLFQNCENFGAFVSFNDLSSTDPHKDSWMPVYGLEVKNGEWVKVEAEVEEKLRLSDRHYINSKLASIAIQGDENSATNIAIRNRLNSFIGREVRNFGGPCSYSNPERLPISNTGFAVCNGLNLADVLVDVIPSANVYRSAIKKAACDYIASNASVQANIKTHIANIAPLVESENVPYLAYQLFYLGQQPRRRTMASLEDLYSEASGSNNLREINDEGVKLLTLALCHSNGWESP